jgi:hypothetical protein
LITATVSKKLADTEFLIEEQVDRFRFMEENERMIAVGGRPATGRPPTDTHQCRAGSSDPALILYSTHSRNGRKIGLSFPDPEGDP